MIRARAAPGFNRSIFHVYGKSLLLVTNVVHPQTAQVGGHREILKWLSIRKQLKQTLITCNKQVK